MQDFPPNSQKAKTRPAPTAPPEPKKIERVTSANAEVRKRGLGRQLKETFIGGTARVAFEYMITDVVVPSVRDLIFDAMHEGLNRLIYGESSRPKRPSGMTPPSYATGHFNYSAISKPTAASKPAQRTLSRGSRARHDFGEIVIQSREEATEVIDRMFDLLGRFGAVAVGDLYELTGIEGSHTDYKWGWRDLRGAKAARLRDNTFLLDLPDPIPLDG